MFDIYKALQPLIDAKIRELSSEARIEANIKAIRDRINPPKKRSGIASYEDRVAFVAGILYPFFKDAWQVQIECNEMIGDNSDRFWEWYSWVEEDKVDFHDVWIYIFKCMDDEELTVWQSRFKEFITDPNSSEELIEYIQHIFIHYLQLEITRRSTEIVQ